MCLAIPVRVVELLRRHRWRSSISTASARRSRSRCVDDVQVGDYVILHVGYALARLDPDEAERTLALFAVAPRRGGMKYIDEFRDGELARSSPRPSPPRSDPGRSYNLMEFCGGHTHAISRYGVTDLLPPPVRMIHGPGCPVCVLPIGRIDLAIRLALEQRVILVHLRRLPARAGVRTACRC